MKRRRRLDQVAALAAMTRRNEREARVAQLREGRYLRSVTMDRPLRGKGSYRRHQKHRRGHDDD